LLVVLGVLLIIVLINVIVFSIIERNKRKDNIGKNPEKPSFKAIVNKYERIEDVQSDLRKAGLESTNLILGIDFTASNVHTGTNTFRGKCLHSLEAEDQPNPYQQVIQILGKTLEPFDEDKFIPTFGFGDSTTTDRSVLPFFSEEEVKELFLKPKARLGFQLVLERYAKLTPTVKMAGPTDFAPIIREAVRICHHTGKYHILVIIADGQVTSERATKAAIVEASNYPLSILLVGVGDGPWTMMRKFDNELPKRKFDNFQFVNFHEVKSKSLSAYFEPSFALEALMEIPIQYKLIKKLNLIENPSKSKDD